MNARERLQKMRDIAEGFTFESLVFVETLPDSKNIIYNGFPPDEVQRMDVPEDEKMRNMNLIIQRIVLGILNNMHNRGLPLETPDVKAFKQIDDHTGREVIVLFVTVKE